MELPNNLSLIRLIIVVILSSAATVSAVFFLPAIVARIERALTDIRISITLAVVFGPLTAWLLFTASLWVIPSYLTGPIAVVLLASGFLSLLGLTGCLLALFRRFKSQTEPGRNDSEIESQP